MKLNDRKTAVDVDTAELGGMSRAIALLVCFLVVVLDGFNTTSISFVVPMLARDWHLTPAAFTPVFVATNVGAAIGFIVTGSLANRFGHRSVGLASVMLFGGCTLLTMYANNVALLSVMRVLAAIGLGAALPIAITASAAIIGGKHKVAASVLVTTGMSVGAVTGGLVGGPLMHRFGWQAVFLIGGILPFVVAPAFFRVLPSAASAPTGTQSRERPVASTVRALFANGRAGYTSVLWLFSFLIFMDVYALLFWLPTMLLSFGFSLERAPAGMAAFSVGGLSGNLLMTAAVTAMTVAGRLRVKSALAVGIVCVIAGITALSQAALSPSIVLLSIGVIGAGLVNGIMGQTALAVAFYPPSIRATGVGWGHAIGRIGSFVGPAIGGALLATGWDTRNIVLVAVVPAIAAIAALGLLTIIGRGATGGDTVADGAPIAH
ncbi:MULTISPECIES: MFS transporter [Burkholderia]|uniref:4-hydroxybenzoate transporter n=1 Tax=Burkholderia aenigmatica TaxID=2015348 RepID=A0A6J5IW19_9BURK|nr:MULTISPECIES: MFS transporter [Burkholderia]CAB3963895.1 4-hydroxybenzoate transporter [Burkholderia aenigmatica]